MQQEFIRQGPSSLGLALICGLVGTFIAWGSGLVAPGIITSLDRWYYDQWLLKQEKPSGTSSMLFLTNEEKSPREGTEAPPIDRAVIAQLIDALDRAGAKVIGVDIPLQEPSPPSRGGATSDAMLLEATARSKKVVFSLPVNPMKPTGGVLGSADRERHLSYPLWSTKTPSSSNMIQSVQFTQDMLPPVVEGALDVGHALVVQDLDGVVRRAPLVTTLRGRIFPSFSMALYTRYQSASPHKLVVVPGDSLQFPQDAIPGRKNGDLHIPIDANGNTLLTSFPKGLQEGMEWLHIGEVRPWVEKGDIAKLRSKVSGKLVVLSFPKQRQVWPTPIHQATPHALYQASVLASLFQERWVRKVPPFLQHGVTVILSCFAAWLFFGFQGWKAPVMGGLIIGGFILLAMALLEWGHLVVALWSPSLAILLSSGLAALWVQVSSGSRILDLLGKIRAVQGELIDVRETLVTRESTVESLEEDLDAARLAESQTAEKAAELVRTQEILQTQCQDAKIQEEQTRTRIEDLTRELHNLRAVTVEQGELRDSQLERLRVECQNLGILTREPQVLALFKDLQKASRSTLSILIQGEPGTGKELFARAVHRLSPRSARPFIAVNMAAISPELFESELFGHVKGSFTGALQDRKGFFELAHHGTIFLDEIGDLPYEQQGKLLRVLQEQTFYRVGATVPTAIDVRVVVATNKHLSREVSQGRFREDLFFRLKGLLIHLPPLRERRQDIPLLAECFVAEASRQAGREGLKFSGEAMHTIETHRWDGNIRELQQVIHQAVALAEGMVITKEDLRILSRVDGEPLLPQDGGSPQDFPGSDQAVLTMLRHHEFDMQSTARALGWDRSTVTQRLKGMGFQALVETRGNRAEAARDLAGTPELAKRVELKLQEYYQHLIKTVQPFATVGPAIHACRKRFKNLPERHFKFVELLIREFFDRSI